MCDVVKQGFLTNSGQIVEAKPYLNIADIPEAVKDELKKANASQMDLLFVRSDIAENKAETRKLKSLTIENRASLEKLNEKFYVEIKNGDKEPTRKHISEVIVDMYERETNRRHLSYFYALLSRHKILVYVIIAGFFLANIGFYNYISKFFDWMRNNIFEIVKLIF